MNGWDVIVVGAGNAALAAAVSARERGARRVLALEKAPRALRGGNTHYSGGLLRIAFDRPDDLRPLVPDAEREVPGFYAGVEPYPHRLFMADLLRVTDGRTDPELAELLIGRSHDTACWMARQGIEMEPAVSLSAVKVGDTYKWSPGAVIRARHEGVGLSAMWFKIAERQGVEVRYDTAAERLLLDRSGRVTGVAARGPNGLEELSARAVVLGCGGFEANPEWRARYLGRPWDHAKVRGTRYNTGDGLRMAMEVGALPHGQWTGCHSTPIDANAPPHGDAKVTHLLEGRYQTGTPVVADTLEALVEKLPLDHAACRRALEAYNAAVTPGRFDPTVRDGLATRGLTLPKSNWAQRLDIPPYAAYPVTGGITFTFGGVRVTDRAQVVSMSWSVIPGLYACGEMVGGLFHGNYPGGTGLMSGAVFGRLAGAEAAGACPGRPIRTRGIARDEQAEDRI